MGAQSLMAETIRSSRRRFIQFLLGGSVLGFLTVVFYPVVRYVFPPRGSESVGGEVLAGNVAELQLNTAKIFRFGDRPGILIRTQDGEWRAFSAVCTHLQCTVQYDPRQKLIWCACHNGYFDLTGRNVAGPPPNPLETYRVDVRGEEIFVSKGA